MTLNDVVVSVVGSVVGIPLIAMLLEKSHKVWKKFTDVMGWVIVWVILMGLLASVVILITHSLTVTILASAALIAWAIWRFRS